MRDFRTYQLAKDVYFQLQKLQLNGVLGDQIERASTSIVLNLAEGSGRPSAKDRKRFFSMALGSVREVQAILELNQTFDEVPKLDLLAASLFRLIQNPGTIKPKP